MEKLVYRSKKTNPIATKKFTFYSKINHLMQE